MTVGVPLGELDDNDEPRGGRKSVSDMTKSRQLVLCYIFRALDNPASRVVDVVVDSLLIDDGAVVGGLDLFVGGWWP